MFQRLLTLVDGSPFGMRALPYAAWLAAAAHGEVLLVRRATAEEQREDVEWELAREVRRLQRRGLAARTLVDVTERRQTVDVLLAAQQAQQAGLIVLATHGGRGPERALWGSTADDLLRHTPVPVLLVPKRSQHAWPRRRPLRVLLSLDGSGLAEPALLLASRLAAVTTIQLLLAAPIDPLDHAVPNARAGAGPAPSTSSERLTPYLDAIARRARSAGMETTVHLGSDGAELRLVEVVRDEHSDLIVLATSSRRGALRALFGGTAPDARCRPPIPLLVPRAADAAPP